VAKTTAAAPPRPCRDIFDTDDVVEIGSGQPLLCLHSGDSPITPTDSHLRRLQDAPHHDAMPCLQGVHKSTRVCASAAKAEF
jgi:hypothetical protein